MRSRVEVLDDDNEGVTAKVPQGLVGPPRPPGGVALKKAGKSAAGAAARTNQNDNNANIKSGDGKRDPSEGEEGEEEAFVGPPRPDDGGVRASAPPAVGDRLSYLERELQDFPLFMSDLPKEPSDIPDVAALQALAAEETPEERAENFKNSGNECLQNGGARWWDDAIEYYTRAIRCGSKDLPKVSVYFSNRAAVQILKKNWGHALRDSLEAMQLDANNVKAAFRASKACFELRKLDEALKHLKVAQSVARQPLQQLSELEKEIARAMRKERLQQEKRAKETQEVLERESELASVVQQRGYRFTHDDVYGARPRMQQFDAKVRVDDESGQQLRIATPVMVVFPQGRQSDFVQSWSEDLFIRDLLDMLFKEGDCSSWDHWGLYRATEVGNMLVYVKTNDRFDASDKQEWVPVKLSSTLGECMRCHPHYLIPVIPVLFVLHANFKKDFFGPESQSIWGPPAKRIEED